MIWTDAVYRAARAAFAIAVSGLDGSARSLHARAAGERTLAGRLKDISHRGRRRAHERTQSFEERFVTGLTELVAREDRAALAALRRALGTTPDHRPRRRVVYRLLPANVPQWRERDCWLVAGLFALHPQRRSPRRREIPPEPGGLAAAARGESVSPEGVERRLIALLNAEREDLDDHLRHAVAQLRAHDIGVDYVQLLRDLRGWGAEERWVQRRWARAFWGQSAQPQPTTEGEVA